MELNRANMKKLAALTAFAVLLLAGTQHLDKLAAALGLAWSVVSPLLLGGALAFVLNVPMRFLEKNLFSRPARAGRRRFSPALARALSLLATFVLAAVILLLLVLVIVPQLAESVSGLGNRIMDAFWRFVPWAEEQFAAYPQITRWLEGLTFDWEALLASAVDFAKNGFGSVLSSTISATKSIVSALSSGFVAFVFAIYLLLQKEKLGLQCRKALYALLPKRAADRAVEIARLTCRVFMSFITGQCMEAVILGAMFFVSMTIFRMPYALLVSCLIAVTALIPIVGAFIGCGVGVFLLLLVSPVKALTFLVLFLVLQQLEGNLIYPHVVGSSVGLPSIWVLAAVSIGGSLLGVVGMLVFIPLTSVAYTLFREFVYRRLRERKLRIR